MMRRLVIDGQVISAIREDVDRASLPVLEVARELVDQLRDRVHVAGLAGDGAPWSDYRAKRRPPKKGDRFYWSPVGEATPPDGRFVLARQGPRAGRAAYADRAAYLAALGFPLPPRKRFVMTGELAASLHATQPKPTVVSILYARRGRRSKLFRSKTGAPYTNQKVAQFAFRTERMSPLVPSESERRWFLDQLAARVPATYLRTLQAAEGALRGVTAAKRLIGRANKLTTGSV